MAKFCGKCGSRLDVNTGLCPHCDREKLETTRELPKTEEEVFQEGKDHSLSIDGELSPPIGNGKKPHSRRRKGVALKIRLTSLAVVILLGGILCALTYFYIIRVPFLSDTIAPSVSTPDAGDWEDIPKTDTGGITYYPSAPENIVQDPQTGIAFVNNEILVALESEAYRSQLEDTLQPAQGQIVGEIPQVAQYQVLLDRALGYNEMEDLVAYLESFDWVVYASPNYAMETDVQFIPNDKEWKNEWEDVPDGTNWGLEAIDAPGAWEYREQMETVNVGVFDNMFLGNPDLTFAETPLGHAELQQEWDQNPDTMELDSHGTHVAGTIAAGFNDKTGISGILPSANLYGVSSQGLWVEGLGTLQCHNVAFAYLIDIKQCSVVNMSLGYERLITFNASREAEEDGDGPATRALQKFSGAVGDFLQLLIDRGHQFVICKSAGNRNDPNTQEPSYQYFRKDEDDNINPYDYICYGDYLDYLAGNGGPDGEEKFGRYRTREAEIAERLVSGNLDAEFDILGAIQNPEVADRIIMVGAVETKGTHKEGGFFGIGATKVHDGYEITPYSQCGERVDILAPGGDNDSEMIYSTIQERQRFGYKWYGGMYGTSMASPHVAGVTAMVFAVNPDLRGEDIKQIIIDSAVGSYGEEGYGLLNAKNAVEMALDYKPKAEAQNRTLTKEDLIGCYWEQTVQSHVAYRFLENGIMEEYFLDPDVAVTDETVEFYQSYQYEVKDNQLFIYWEEDSQSPTKLEFVYKTDDIQWDSGLKNQLDIIPDGEAFLYSTDWEPGEGVMRGNAFYLIKCMESPHSDLVGIYETTFGTRRSDFVQGPVPGKQMITVERVYGNQITFRYGEYPEDQPYYQTKPVTVEWAEGEIPFTLTDENGSLYEGAITFHGTQSLDLEFELVDNPGDWQGYITNCWATLQKIWPEIPAAEKDGPTVSFSPAQLEELAQRLGVPEDLDVEIRQSEPYYWDTGERWLIQVDVYERGKIIAGSEFDVFTLEAVGGILMYDPSLRPSQSSGGTTPDELILGQWGYNGRLVFDFMGGNLAIIYGENEGEMMQMYYNISGSNMFMRPWFQSDYASDTVNPGVVNEAVFQIEFPDQDHLVLRHEDNAETLTRMSS